MWLSTGLPKLSDGAGVTSFSLTSPLKILKNTKMFFRLNLYWKNKKWTWWLHCCNLCGKKGEFCSGIWNQLLTSVNRSTKRLPAIYVTKYPLNTEQGCGHGKVITVLIWWQTTAALRRYKQTKQSIGREPSVDRDHIALLHLAWSQHPPLHYINYLLVKCYI